jgi:hypothetical protein
MQAAVAAVAKALQFKLFLEIFLKPRTPELFYFNILLLVEVEEECLV